MSTFIVVSESHDSSPSMCCSMRYWVLVSLQCVYLLAERDSYSTVMELSIPLYVSSPLLGLVLSAEEQQFTDHFVMSEKVKLWSTTETPVCLFILIYLYPSRICVVCVAPSHVLFEPAPGLEILSVDFHFGRTDRTKNQVSGKGKNKWFWDIQIKDAVISTQVLTLTLAFNSVKLTYCNVDKAVCD